MVRVCLTLLFLLSLTALQSKPGAVNVKPGVTLFKVYAYGIPVGFARFTAKKKGRCTMARSQTCYKFTLSANMVKFKDLVGKFIIISDVEYTVKGFQPHFNRFKVKIGEKKTIFTFTFKNEQLIIRYPDEVKKQKLPENGHTMATLPIFLLYQQPAKSTINVMIEGDFQTMQVTSKQGEEFVTFWAEGEEVAKIRRRDQTPLSIRSLPIKFMGIPLDGISAQMVEKDNK